MITFRDGPTGRRAGLISGPDVWEVAMWLDDFGEPVEDQDAVAQLDAALEQPGPTWSNAAWRRMADIAPMAERKSRRVCEGSIMSALSMHHVRGKNSGGVRFPPDVPLSQIRGRQPHAYRPRGLTT